MILLFIIPLLIIFCLIIDSKYKDVEPFIIPCEPYPGGYSERGEANGYLAIKEGHPLHGYTWENYDYDNFNPIEWIHGGVTWGKYDTREENPFKPCYTIGFDTAHLGDTPQKWPREKVEKVTRNWANNVNNFYHPLYFFTLKFHT